jgi:UDP-N-acetyl-2-amino-2-deoxyglucuronate dehydrogenase
MSTVRVGIVGCGNIAKTHATALAALSEGELAAACDVDEGRAKAFAAQFGAPNVYTDVDAMVRGGNVDAIIVCTPHPFHAPVVVAAAEAGVHVLCEKPISDKLSEADRMVEAAERAGITFSVVFQRRWWPACQRIRQAIDAGKLGKLTVGESVSKLWRAEEYFAADAWRGKWATEGGGVLMNQAVHALDMFQWFMGPAVEVVGRWAKLRAGDYIDVEDTAVATVVFANGALGTILAATTITPGFGFRVTVHGENGATVSVWENPEGRQGVNDVWTVPDEEELRAGWEAEDRDKPGFPFFHQLQLQDFLQAVRDRRPPAVAGAEGIKSLEIISAIYESSRTGKAIPLPMART